MGHQRQAGPGVSVSLVTCVTARLGRALNQQSMSEELETKAQLAIGLAR